MSNQGWWILLAIVFLLGLTAELMHKRQMAHELKLHDCQQQEEGTINESPQ